MKRDKDKAMIDAMIACFLAIGAALGDDVLDRAGDHIRELLEEEPFMAPGANEILEHVLAGIDYTGAH